MPQNDAWDWPLLYYVGTVILHMSPIQFWKCTPRKLNALSLIHASLHNPKDEKDEMKFIDEVF
jgi:hypothetical protein